MSTIEKGVKALLASFWVSDSSGKVIIRSTESDGNPEKLMKQLIRGAALQALIDAPDLDVMGVVAQMLSNTADTGDLSAFNSVFLEYSLDRYPALACSLQLPLLDRADKSALPVSAVLLEGELDRICEYAGSSLMVSILSNDHGQVLTQTGKGEDQSLSLPS